MILYKDSEGNAMTVPDNLVTRTVGGYDFSLEAGLRYRASRPMAEKGRTTYPVSIRCITSQGEALDPDVIVTDLSLKEANELLAAFNNDTISFKGRVWQ